MSPDIPAIPQAGVLVAVVGPSGAGKDTLIRAAAEHLAGDDRYRFARRIITRAADRQAEDHETLDREVFEEWEAGGRFSLTWRAHGLCYGLPDAVLREVAGGTIVVANLSRKAIEPAIKVFPRVATITVTAPPEVLVDRIVARGREDRASAQGRVARAVPALELEGLAGEWVVDNSGAIDRSVASFCEILRSLSS